MDIYIAKKDDSVAKAAKKCGVSAIRLAADNGVFPHAPLAEGQTLLVRKVAAAHTVRHKETLRSIAARYGLSMRRLYRFNPHLYGMPQISTGQSLAVRLTTSPCLPVETLAIVPNYPQPQALRAALPFLTYVCPPPCQTAVNGGLQIKDTTSLFQTALDYDTLPLEHISIPIPLSPAAKHRFTQTVLHTAKNSGAAGAVIRAPYKNHICDTFGNDFLVFDAKNDFLEISYRAILYKNGKNPTLIPYEHALSKAVQNHAEIRFDQSVNRPFFCYKDTDNTVCEVWFHDPRSIYAQVQTHHRNLPLRICISDLSFPAAPLAAIATLCQITE